eukprot:scaffold1450_cov170-Amphora_coffeaeformis.AAC.3
MKRRCLALSLSLPCFSITQASTSLPRRAIIARATTRSTTSSKKNPFYSTVSRGTSTTAAAAAETADNFISYILPRAFNEIGLTNLIDKKDPSLRVFLRDAFKEYGNGVTREVEFNKRHDLTKLPLDQVLREYESIRGPAAGVGPLLAFACLLHPVSSMLYGDPEFRSLIRLGSLISGIDNDVQSQNKDDEWDFVNIVANVGNFEMDQAIQRACERHFQLMAELRNKVGRLARLDPSVQEWNRFGAQSIIRGFVSWQCHVKRYKNNNDSSLLEKLFPNEPYHVVREDGTFKGMNVDILNELNRDIAEYGERTGLFGSFLPPPKLEALNPSLCSMLLMDYAIEKDMEVLKVLNRLFVCLVVADDIWEQEKFHHKTKVILFDCFDTFV